MLLWQGLNSSRYGLAKISLWNMLNRSWGSVPDRLTACRKGKNENRNCKDLAIGTGAPKIIVSLMAKDIASVKSEALAYREADFDILEWRVDHYADLSNVESVMAAAKFSVKPCQKNRCCLPTAVPKKAASRRFPPGLYCTQSCSHRQRPRLI